jgi:hypothetical protein
MSQSIHSARMADPAAMPSISTRLARMASSAEPRSPTSPIWQAALEKYYTELAKGGFRATAIDKEVWNIESPDDLLAQIEALGPDQETQSSSWSKAVTQLQPVLVGLGDFAALTMWMMGMNGKVATILWGSIRLIVKVWPFQNRLCKARPVTDSRAVRSTCPA